MTEKLFFEIPGKPFAKQRPRHGNGFTFTPKETVSFEQTVRQLAVHAGAIPVEGPVQVHVTAIFKIPKSWSKKKVAEHLWQPHTQRPDGDNIMKAVLDGLNRIAFADDAQAARQVVEKQWGDIEKTIVEVKPL